MLVWNLIHFYYNDKTGFVECDIPCVMLLKVILSAILPPSAIHITSNNWKQANINIIIIIIIVIVIIIIITSIGC